MRMEMIASGLTGFDYVVIVLVGLLALMGVMRGFTHEALSLAGWVAAILVVRFFHEPATIWAAGFTGGKATAAILAFVVLFFGTVLFARLLATAAGGLAKRSPIGPLDRVLGGGFGAVKGVILSAVLFLLVGFGTGVFSNDRVPPEWLRESRARPLLQITADVMVGWVAELNEGRLGLPGMPAIPGLPPGLDGRQGLPPGHPMVPDGFDPRRALPPGVGGRIERGGYTAAEREALDRLLDEAASQGEEVAI